VSRKSVLWIALAGILLFAVVMAVLETQRGDIRVRQPVDVGEATALFERTVQLARTGKLEEICHEVAEIPQSCRSLLRDTLNTGWRPGPDKPEIVSVSHPGEGFPPTVLRVVGVRADGTSYDADFGVSRESSGRAVVHYPIFWSGVSYDYTTSEPCPDVGPNEVCARKTISPPR
jgi:hypothetical protein